MGLESSNRFDAQLPPELGSVVAARHLVNSAASAWGMATDTAEDAALAVSELVTNAVLHAGTVVHVAVCRLGQGMRLEVQDRSRRMPVTDLHPADPRLSPSTTGRGLALLASTVDRWGVDPSETGKVVWAEVGTGRPNAVPGAEPSQPAVSPSGPDVAGVVPAYRAAAAAERRQVRLLGVPVRMLVESARQFADLQREMQVIGLDHNGPAELIALAATSREISARIGSLPRAGSDAAEAALARGESVVDFDVLVADDAVATFDRLATLIRRVGDEVVRRHLLTMPPSVELTAYRQWYRDEIVAQLTGRAPSRCPFAAFPP